MGAALPLLLTHFVGCEVAEKGKRQAATRVDFCHVAPLSLVMMGVHEDACVTVYWQPEHVLPPLQRDVPVHRADEQPASDSHRRCSSVVVHSSDVVWGHRRDPRCESTSRPVATACMRIFDAFVL